MKRTIALLVVALVLGGAMLPSSAWGWYGGYYGGYGGWWGPGAIIGGLVLGAVAIATAPFWLLSGAPAYYPPVTYGPPMVYGRPPSYAPPVAYTPPTYAPPARISAVRREVVYPNGRYVLYGDGVRQPWQWVWMPSASPPPPPASSPPVP